MTNSAYPTTPAQCEVLQMTLREYLDRALAGFKNDPADSEFQHGYLAALEELSRHEKNGAFK